MSSPNTTEATGLHPTARPAEKRQDIKFAEKDTELRTDVHDLGFMVGELLREQGGDALYDTVEAARKTAIERREGDPAAGRHLDALVKSLSAVSARDFIRAFSTFFQVVNTAEQVHRIRRRRDYMKDASTRQPGSVDEVLFRLKEEGKTRNEVLQLLNSILVEPVFTSDAVEPTRRTILRKQQNIVRRMVDLQNPVLTPREKQGCFESIRADITTIWQTEEHPHEVRTVFDDLEHTLFYLTDVIYKAIPPFYESIQAAFNKTFDTHLKMADLDACVRFASWIGGDMVSRPDISARTIRESLARHRTLLLNLYFEETGIMTGKLSQSTSRVKVSEALLKRIEHYEGHFPNTAGLIPPRHRDMPYRIFLRFVRARLQSTFDDDVYPYESSDEFYDDIQLIHDSLERNKGRHAGLFGVQRLLRRIETFGFHFIALDIRQNALLNREVVGYCLGIEDWCEKSAEFRIERIREALRKNESPSADLNNDSRRTLAVLQAIAFCRRKYGKRAIGPYIISLAHGIDDILSVILLARWADLRNKDGNVPLDIAPSFETVEDLTNCAQTMRELLKDPVYREHVEQRGNVQTIMVSYSDSNRDAGMASARWSLQQAQSDLVDVLREAKVEMNLFHGRGGTTSRGGGKTHAAVLGSPAGAVQGRLRATEQGELVNAKYGVRGVTIRTLEQAVGSVALATALPQKEMPQEAAEWAEIMNVITAASRERYKTLVYDSPDFFDYFAASTPVDALTRLREEMQPDLAENENGNGDARGVHWDFAWTQNRAMLPGWFGVGSGLASAVQRFGVDALRDMAKSWNFFRALIYDVEVVMAKADLNITNRYSALAGDLHDKFFPIFRTEFDLALEQVLTLKGQQVLLENQPTLRRAVRLRNPYVDPMSLLQVDLLHRWRSSKRKDEALFDALIASINGIARGLQDSG